MIRRWSWHDRQFCPDDARWRLGRFCGRIVEPRYEDCDECRALREQTPVLEEAADELLEIGLDGDDRSDEAEEMFRRIREACEILSGYEYYTFYDTMVRLDKLKDLCRPSAPDYARRATYVAQETALLVRELKLHIEAYRVRSSPARLGAWALGWIRPEVVDVENGVVLRPTRRCMLGLVHTRLWIRLDQRRRKRERGRRRSFPHNP